MFKKIGDCMPVLTVIEGNGAIAEDAKAKLEAVLAEKAIKENKVDELNDKKIDKEDESN